METQEGECERDELVMNLVAAVLSRPEDERESFLEETCAGDPDLLANVRRRVEWERKLGGFLLSPVVPRERMDRPFAVGDLVAARFRILSLAGEGGMGVVYEAFDEKLRHRVAIKCGKFEFRRRLSPEALHSLRVTHSNVCRVFEIHTESTSTGEVDFITMEFLEGETLAARLSSAPGRWLESPEGRAIALQICDGLQAAHEQGVIHRDLKASNVMLTKGPDGKPRAVIMDFGIAQGGDILSGQVRGTPAYVAPELWRGKPASPQSDIYALGVLLYEMASARRPYLEGVTWKQRLHRLPLPPDARQPWRAAILRCLDPNPLRRFASVARLEQELRTGRARRWWPAAAAVVAVLLTALGVRQWMQPTSQVRLAILPPHSDETGRELAGGFAHDLAYRLKTLRSPRRPLLVFPLSETGGQQIAKPSEAAQMLGATHVIETAFQKEGNQWRIRVTLSDASSGKVLQQLDRLAPDAGLFSVQTAAVTMTTSRLSVSGHPRPATLIGEAYVEYLQGLHLARIDYEKSALAVPHFEKVIQIAPNSALGYAGLAEALLNTEVQSNQSYESRTLEALARAEQLDPDASHVRIMAGRLNMRTGWYERALLDFRRAAELDPADPEPRVQIAYALERLNRRAEAEEAFNSAVKVQPGYYRPHIDAGVFFSRKGDYPRAEREWLEALRCAPGHSRARLNLASIYITLERLADAEQQARAALAIRRSAQALLTTGYLHQQAGRNAEAIADYEEAMRIPPRNFKRWILLGSVYRRVGRQAEAETAFRKGLEDSEQGLKVYPRGAEYAAWVAYYHAFLGQPDAARSRAAQALAIEPANPDIRLRVALAYDGIGDFPAACRLLEETSPDVRRRFRQDSDVSPALRADPKCQSVLQ